MDIPRKMVEAGARALCDQHWGEGVFDGLVTLQRLEWIDRATAVIHAAIGCAEVVRTCEGIELVTVENESEDAVAGREARPGDTILIVRAEKGEGNG